MQTNPNCKGLGPASAAGLEEDVPCVCNTNNSLQAANCCAVQPQQAPSSSAEERWQSWPKGKLDNFPSDAVYWPNKGGDTAVDLIPGRWGPIHTFNLLNYQRMHLCVFFAPS